MSYFDTRKTAPSFRPAFFGGFGLFPPVIKALLISNVIVWLLLDVLLVPFRFQGIPIFLLLGDLLALHPLGSDFWPWQLLTYMFLHGGFFHLFFNMLALWMFGMELEQTWGSRKFLFYYLACGVGGGLVNLLVAPLVGQTGPTVGASGAVFGVLLAFGVLFPDRPIYLYFLVPVRAKYFIAGYIALELIFGVTGTSQGVAHFAHLGGAAVGFLYLLLSRDMVPRRPRWWPFGRRSQLRSIIEPTIFRVNERGEVRDATFYDVHTGRPTTPGGQRITQEMIDTILDKITRSGYQSLDAEEKRILDQASKNMN